MNAKHRTLGLIWGSALLPIVLASVTYFAGISPEERKVRGRLVEPVQTLQQWGGDRSEFVGRWHILMVSPKTCEVRCEEQLDALRRIHDALGREADRVRVSRQSVEENALTEGVWIVDPLGNLVLQYPESQIGKPILEDLKHLLRISRIG